MKQASFQIGNSVNKEKNNVTKEVNVPNEVNLQKEVNKNTITSHTITSHTITSHTKTNNKPRKLVENIYYF
jgi:hypothetical protein